MVVQQEAGHAHSHPWGLASYWFSLNFQGAALLTIVIPTTLSTLARATRTSQLARLAALAALMSMLVPPLLGILSDRLRARGVHRRPLLLFGTALNVGGLLWALEARSVGELTLGFLVSVFGQSAATAAYQAMMPEVVEPRHWGEASGYMGIASLAGTVAGLATAGLTAVSVVYAAMMGTAVTGAAATVALVREPDHVEVHARPKAAVRDWDRFAWVFAARFFVLFGQTILMTFVLYFFEEVLRLRAAASGTALVAALALGGAALSTFFMGRASDRGDRTRTVAMAGVPMAVAATGFAVFPYPFLIFALAVVWGVGYGAFLSVDWALALDSIPDLSNVARDLGVWGIASNLPAVVAPLVGGFILAHAATPRIGYRVLFLTAGASFAAGSALVLRSRPRSRGAGWLQTGLSLLVAAVLWSYVGLMYRVRVLGRLPRDRRGLVVLGNHLHDLEGMVIPARLFLARPWQGPVRTAASVRVFEPGLLASRAPRWLGPWLAPLNVGRIVRALGVLPIENMPLSRPVASWAYEVWQAHGDLPLAQVLTPEALGRVGESGSRRLRALWAPGRQPQLGPMAPVTCLREPFRSQARERLRARVADQVRTLVAAMGDGETVYITPEGRMSTTGELGRFRAALDPLLASARAVILAATAYDPWAARRLLMVTRLTAPLDPADLRASLMAARPVTVSQQLADHIVAHPQGGSLTALVNSARPDEPRRLGAFLAPQRRDERAVRRAVARMAARGVIRVDGGRWRPGPRRDDARFAHVPDLVAAQARQYRDTLAALSLLAKRQEDPPSAVRESRGAGVAWVGGPLRRGHGPLRARAWARDPMRRRRQRSPQPAPGPRAATGSTVPEAPPPRPTGWGRPIPGVAPWWASTA